MKTWSSLSNGYTSTRIYRSCPPYALRELVKAIYIEAPDKSSGKRRQGIRISYDLVGFIPVDELMKQERHERSHAVPAKSNITFLCSHAIWAGRFYITILAAGEASENAIDFCIFIWHNQTPPPHFSGCNAAFYPLPHELRPRCSPGAGRLRLPYCT